MYKSQTDAALNKYCWTVLYCYTMPSILHCGFEFRERHVQPKLWDSHIKLIYKFDTLCYRDRFYSFKNSVNKGHLVATETETSEKIRLCAVKFKR